MLDTSSPLWENMKRQAKAGIIEVENLPPAEYKYFSELKKLYENYDNGLMTLDTAKREEAKLLEEYTDYERTLLVARKEQQQNELTVNNYIRALEAVDSVQNAFPLAVEAIGILIGDMSFKDRMLKKEATSND